MLVGETVAKTGLLADHSVFRCAGAWRPSTRRPGSHPVGLFEDLDPVPLPQLVKALAIGLIGG